MYKVYARPNRGSVFVEALPALAEIWQYNYGDE